MYRYCVCFPFVQKTPFITVYCFIKFPQFVSFAFGSVICSVSYRQLCGNLPARIPFLIQGLPVWYRFPLGNKQAISQTDLFSITSEGDISQYSNSTISFPSAVLWLDSLVNFQSVKYSNPDEGCGIFQTRGRFSILCVS